MPPRKPRTLKLATLAPQRDSVDIDGELHEIKHPDELSLADHEEVKRINDAWKDLPPEGDDEHTNGVRRQIMRLLRVVFVETVPRETLDRLTFPQVEQVADFLLDRWQGTLQPRTQRPQPGRKRSPSKK